ncbi:MAG: hypothetical protein JSW66_01290 [Phycisphaerales bacterium]|nr:MAG: hypothetical protein JSW66_01290 [Phycisphaerales bacterium]
MKEKASNSELLRFGVIMSSFLALLAGVLIWRDKGYYAYLLVLSVLFLVFGLMRPAVLRPVHKSWMTFSTIIGWFMSRLILILLFYLVVTPTALLLRIMGHDMLNIKSTKTSRESYWIPRKRSDSQNRDYERQF